MERGRVMKMELERWTIRIRRWVGLVGGHVGALFLGF
jgi:hypothetical protein